LNKHRQGGSQDSVKVGLHVFDFIEKSLRKGLFKF